MKTQNFLPAIVAIVMFITPAIAQQKSSDLNNTIQAWLLKSEKLPTEDIMTCTMQENASETEAILTSALKNGPDGNYLDKVVKAAARQYDNMKNKMSITRERYIYQEVDFVISDYKSEAVAALGMVASENAVKQLQAIANSKNPMLKEQAEYALENLCTACQAVAVN